MKTFFTLMQREWLQHRFGWSLLAGVPLVLSLLLLTVGQIQLGDGKAERLGEAFPALLAMISIMAAGAIIFLILGITSLILVMGLARRDHQDRSIEFWLSLPTGHAVSLAAPLLMHLLVVPAVALLIGAVGGWLVSLVLVTRVLGFEAWLGLPWRDLIAAVLALATRVLVGLPLALLWVAPLILAQVLCNAWFKRWGLPVLLLALVLGGLLLDRWLGSGTVSQVLSDVLQQAGQALIAASHHPMEANSSEDFQRGLLEIPGWALADLGAAFKALASPLFLACIATAGLLFALLVDWRRRGAGAPS